MAINTQILNTVRAFYTENGAGNYSHVSEAKKNASDWNAINHIHVKLGWGDLTKSLCAKICWAFLFLTPKAAKIKKAIRVYKVETFDQLKNEIQNEINNVGRTKSRKEVRNALHAKFPHYTRNEIDYIMSNDVNCTAVMDRVKGVNISFEEKNKGWKEISSKVRELACQKCCEDRGIPAPDYSKDNDVTHCEAKPVHYKAIHGETIGIAEGPNWNAFTPFTWTEGNFWKGELPIGKEYKFIKLDQDKATWHWQTGHNRILNDRSEDAVTAGSQNVYFQ